MPKYENLPAEYEFVKPSPTLAQRAEKALRELGGFVSGPPTWVAPTTDARHAGEATLAPVVGRASTRPRTRDGIGSGDNWSMPAARRSRREAPTETLATPP